MTSLLRSFTGGEQRFTLNDYLQMLQVGGVNYQLQGGGTAGEKAEPIENNFASYVNGAYKSNGVIFACMAARQLLFSEARFQFQQMINGRPGDLFGTPALEPLEAPWTGATTADLLSWMITDADAAGNSYTTTRAAGVLRRLRPDWVTIVLGSRTGSELDAEVIGYSYDPGGPSSGEDPIVLFPEQVAHFAPYKDPLAKYRGMSWLTPVIEEIVSDNSATTHKRNFFESGAKLGYVVTLDSAMTPDKFDTWVSKFKAGHEQGAMTAYKTLFLAGGADIKTVGADMKQVDFTSVQGHGETRICAAARVPPIIVGLSEGLESATYSNYGQARRAFADLTMRPMWRKAAGSLQQIITVPSRARLWYDARDISFLQEDAQDAATIQQTDAITIRELINAGFDPDTVVKSVMSGDFSQLKHTGLVSVQLQEPGAEAPSSPNGKVPPGVLVQ